MEKSHAELQEIGGYFGLDMPNYPNFFEDDFLVQSARAAIRLVVQNSNKNEVYAPAYVCKSVIDALNSTGCKVNIYKLNSEFYPLVDYSQSFSNSVFLYVNYFGLCQRNVLRLCESVGKENLLIDNSQALFAENIAEVSVYSPRKFVGLPDGGVIKSSSTPRFGELAKDENSINRMPYLLKRFSESAKSGYEYFFSARLSLSDSSPLLMSDLTKALMSTLNWCEIKKIRKRNFELMDDYFSSCNEIELDLNGESALCYPLHILGVNVNEVRNELNRLNVFNPIYWLDAKPLLTDGDFEFQFMAQTLFLPIDQRMNEAQVNYVCNLVSLLINNRKFD